VGNTNDGPTSAEDGADPKDKKDVEAMKGIFKNTGNPNDPGDGSVEIDQEKITAVKKATQAET